MKTYTQQDFEALVRDENGYLHCQAGDGIILEKIFPHSFSQKLKIIFNKSIDKLLTSCYNEFIKSKEETKMKVEFIGRLIRDHLVGTWKYRHIYWTDGGR